MISKILKKKIILPASSKESKTTIAKQMRKTKESTLLEHLNKRGLNNNMITMRKRVPLKEVIRGCSEPRQRTKTCRLLNYLFVLVQN